MALLATLSLYGRRWALIINRNECCFILCVGVTLKGWQMDDAGGSAV